MREDTAWDDTSRERRRTRLRRRGYLYLAAALTGVALLAAACSGGPANHGSGAGSAGGSVRASALAYAQCMRAHGVKSFPDPNAQGHFMFQGTPTSGVDPNSSQFQAADQACHSLLPASLQGPSQAAKAGSLKFAQCMRSHGISSFPDPSSQGAFKIQLKPGSGLDPSNPRFQAAQQACSHFAPGGFIGGTSGGSGGGGA
jgi:hypothetical protein